MKTLLVLILGFGLAVSWVGAQEKVAFDEANPPFMFGKDGKAAGVYPNLFQEAFRRMGVPVVLTATPWKRALQDVDDGVAGIGGVYQNSDRLKKYDFSDPYFEERLGIFVQKGHEFPYSSVADLKGKKVAVLTGWSYGDDFDAAVKAGTIKADAGTNEDKVNFQKLALGRVDAVIAVVEGGQGAVKALKAESSMVLLPQYLAVSKVYLAFGKTAKKIAVLDQFNKVISAMKKDGTFDSIVSRSFASE